MEEFGCFESFGFAFFVSFEFAFFVSFEFAFFVSFEITFFVSLQFVLTGLIEAFDFPSVSWDGFTGLLQVDGP